MLCATTAPAQEGNDSASPSPDQNSETNPTDRKPADHATVRLRIEVTGDNGKPVSNASVYVRYNIPGNLIRKDKLAELDLKTNGDGSARVPAVPQGRVLIQVIAPGWHTFGKWYDLVGKDEDTVEIKLDPPHRWY
jgi:protocatechuate 3,4-dioxygenase beta subunit